MIPWGGGTSIVEGLRLGCKVIGSDINPVAWFVTKKEIDIFDEELTDSYFFKLEKKIGNHIKQFYKTRCNNGHDCDTLYAIWIRKMKCKECKIINELFDSYVIYDTNNKRIIYCPNCNNVFETKQKNDYVRCILCKSSFNVNPKITDQGFFNCINCGFREKIVNSIKRNRKLLNSKIIAIEFECDICGRGFKTPTKIDQDNYLKAEKILEKNKKLLLFPKQKISKR